MKLHRNHRTCPNSRLLICRRVIGEGWSLKAAAEAAGCSERTAAKWLARFRAGDQVLEDRCSRPHRSPTQLPERLVRAIEALRRLRMTAAEIAEAFGLALSTVSLWLKRVGLGKRSRLDPPEPPNRYERRHAGELVHVDVKKLGRILAAGHRVTGVRGSRVTQTTANGRGRGVAGWEFVHVCVDDHSRLAYVEVLGDECAQTAIEFLGRAIAWFAEHGIELRAVLSDNGSCYRRRFSEACRALGLKHLHTRPYRPRTNGKAERFIQTLINEWAYARVYGTSAERTAQLPRWLSHYNFRRPHGSLGHRPPATRLNNLVRNYT
jgi:transposase InsO family protein